MTETGPLLGSNLVSSHGVSKLSKGSGQEAAAAFMPFAPCWPQHWPAYHACCSKRATVRKMMYLTPKPHLPGISGEHTLYIVTQSLVYPINHCNFLRRSPRLEEIPKSCLPPKSQSANCLTRFVCQVLGCVVKRGLKRAEKLSSIQPPVGKRSSMLGDV